MHGGVGGHLVSFEVEKVVMTGFRCGSGSECLRERNEKFIHNKGIQSGF